MIEYLLSLIPRLTLDDVLRDWVFYLIDTDGNIVELESGLIFMTQDWRHLQWMRRSLEFFESRPFEVRSAHHNNLMEMSCRRKEF